MNTIFFLSLCIFTIIQCFFWCFVFLKLLKHTGFSKKNAHYPPISVIICTHNEESNLEKLLPLLTQQKYSVFEIIIVNDKSTDNSKELLEYFSKTHAHFSYINIENTPNDIQSKKFALTQGIKKSKYDYVLLTDADCYPTSNFWIENMAGQSNQYDVILGYSPYEKNKGLLNQLIQFETLYTAIQYLGFTLQGNPYMGIGRNILYKKELFTKADGFSKHQHIIGGDDDLFVNEIATKENTGICINTDSHMYSIPKKTWKTWFIQKTRHISVGKHYQLKHKFFLGLLNLSHIGFYFSTFVCLYLGISVKFASLLFIFRNVCSFFIFYKISKKLNTSLKIREIIWSDFLYVLYIFIVGTIASLQKKVRWK